MWYNDHLHRRQVMSRFRLEGKSFFSAWWTTREFPGNFADKVIYSLLAGISVKGPKTQTWIAEFLNLDAGETVPAALHRLEKWGLVQRVTGGWIAREPHRESSGWFARNRKTTQDWR